MLETGRMLMISGVEDKSPKPLACAGKGRKTYTLDPHKLAWASVREWVLQVSMGAAAWGWPW